jgi:hypothetical protein
MSSNATFPGEDRSAIVGELMREGIARARDQEQRREAVRRILDRRSHAPILTDAAIAALRGEGRP